MGFLCAVNGDIVTLGFDPIDLRCLEEIDASGRFDHETFEIFFARLHLFKQSQNALISATSSIAHDLLPGTSPGNIKTLLVKWLKQVIKRMYLKGPDRVLIIGRDEDYVRKGPVSES